jgi:hypothetical protein
MTLIAFMEELTTDLLDRITQNLVSSLKPEQIISHGIKGCLTMG